MTNWISQKVQGAVAGVGNAAGGAVNSVGNGVNSVGQGIGDAYLLSITLLRPSSGPYTR